MAVSLALAGCGDDSVPEACVELLDCCAELTDADACERSYDAALELDDRAAAADGCAAAVAGIQDLGFCDGGSSGPDTSDTSDTSDSSGSPDGTTAECQALRSCCMQMPAPAGCLTSAAQYQTDPNGEALCRELREVFVESGVCAATESDDLACSDGIDNDGNGFVDCQDFGCTRADNVSVCEGMVENTDALCGDGVDNDGNGFTDCEDFGCSMNAEVTVCSDPPVEGPESTDAACADGFDNDGDGFVDCEDFDCDSPAVSVCGATSPNSESNDVACADGVDNDGDGFIDCDDFDCSMNPGVTVC